MRDTNQDNRHMKLSILTYLTAFYRGADMSLTRPGRKQAIYSVFPIYNHNWRNIKKSKVTVSRDRSRWPKGFRVG